jgi:hypothetical protein
MPYVAPGTVAAGDVYTAAAHNIQVNNVIALQSAIRRLDYQASTATYTISTNMTNLATAPEVFATDLSFTADGTSSYAVEFFCPTILCPLSATYNLWVVLCKGDGTALGTLANIVGGSGYRVPGGVFKYFYTPAAGTQTLNVRCVQETGAGGAGALTQGATSGYTGSFLPMYLAVYGPQQL